MSWMGGELGNGTLINLLLVCVCFYFRTLVRKTHLGRKRRLLYEFWCQEVRVLLRFRGYLGKIKSGNKCV